ncbi:MAG: hypothetical protein FWB78_01740 [Treponema sp.]|nr:hypothetical protein [Treponema sp.]
MNSRKRVFTALATTVVIALTGCPNGNEPSDNNSQGGTSNGMGNTLAKQLEWLRENAQSGGTYTALVSIDESISPAQAALPTGRNNLTITLSGTGAMRTVSLSQNGNLFAVGSGVTLVLDGNVTLKGRGGASLAMQNNIHLVRVDGGGALVMNHGARITGNVNANVEHSLAPGRRGGGVRVNQGGTFTMNGGEIHGNSDIAGGYGGGVLVAGGGVFNMHGGTIFGNRVSFAGAGVSILEGGTFDMHGGSVSENDSGGFGGGGVDNSGGTFNMHGGSVSGNTAGGHGIGVRNNGGTFNMHGGVISGNVGILGSNSHGGGVSNNWGTFTMYGGTISGNTAAGMAGQGGGVANFTNGIFNMRGGAISGNTAALGGGVSNGDGSFRISNGIIHGNEATLPADLRNTGTLGHAALSNNFGIVQHGTFSLAGNFSSLGTLGITNNTIRVVNGELLP